MLLPVGVLSGFTIAFTIRSVDHSLFTRLIPARALMWGNPVLLYTFRAAGALKGWCAVRTLQTSVLYKVELRLLGGYRKL